MQSAGIALVLSDVYLFCKGVKALLESAGLFEEVIVSDNSAEFEDLVQKTNPKIVLVDMECEAFRVEKVLAFCDFTTKSDVLVFSDGLLKEECNVLLDRGAKALFCKTSSKSTFTKGFEVLANKLTFVDESIYKLEKEKSSLLEQLNVSTREKEIIELIAQGLINKEIAERLFISTHTVNTHRKNIMAKLGINNTAGIVLFAVKEGIVSPNDFLKL